MRLSRAAGRSVTGDGGDYSVTGLTSGGLTFSGTQTSRTFTISAIQDTDCADETVDIGFGPLPSGVDEGSPSSAALTIDDDDTCAPPVPTNLRPEASDKILTFRWNASTGATSYFGRLTTAQDQVGSTCSPTGGTTSCTFNDLNNGTPTRSRCRPSGTEVPVTSRHR